MSAVTATADLTTGAPASSRERGRLVGLDGIRGFAALFVVMHHCYLMAFPGFPANTGPAWLAWLFVHIVFLVGFRNRLLVLIQWAWAYLTFDKGARLITRNFQSEQRPPA